MHVKTHEIVRCELGAAVDSIVEKLCGVAQPYVNRLVGRRMLHSADFRACSQFALCSARDNARREGQQQQGGGGGGGGGRGGGGYDYQAEGDISVLIALCQLSTSAQNYGRVCCCCCRVAVRAPRGPRASDSHRAPPLDSSGSIGGSVVVDSIVVSSRTTHPRLARPNELDSSRGARDELRLVRGYCLNLDLD